MFKTDSETVNSNGTKKELTFVVPTCEDAPMLMEVYRFYFESMIIRWQLSGWNETVHSGLQTKLDTAAAENGMLCTNAKSATSATTTSGTAVGGGRAKKPATRARTTSSRRRA
jgi:hypothetical protein